MGFLNTKIERELPEEVLKWLKAEVAEQEERYQKIVQEMKDLDPTRDRWYEEFLQRCQEYGFNADGDQRVKIAEEDIPVKPDREHVVVY